MENPVEIPRSQFTVRIPCCEKPESEGAYPNYYVNYPLESFLSRELPDAQVWEKAASGLGNRPGEYHKLELYEGNTHCATLLVDLSPEGVTNHLVEVWFEGEWGEWFSGVDASEEAVFYGRGMQIVRYDAGSSRTYWSHLMLQESSYENFSTKEEKRELMKKIRQFISDFIDSGKLQQATKGELELGKGKFSKREEVESILNDYLALNPGILEELGFSDITPPIQIPDAIWAIHKVELRALTGHGCISVEGSFRHGDLNLALEIIVNPLLRICYESLQGVHKKNETNSILKAIISNAITTEPPAKIDLTGMSFYAIFPDITFAPGAIIEQTNASIVFDHAKFDGLEFVSENAQNHCNWNHVSLRDASFEGSNLSNITLVRANLTGANFQRANLTDADLTDACIDGADFSGATLTGITWPLLNYNADLLLPELNWNQNGAEFILQQLRKIGEDADPTATIEVKQARAKRIIDVALSKIHESEELIKFAALIDGKESDFAYLREETAFFRGSFFGCHGNTDTWHDIIGEIKIHLDAVLVKEAEVGFNVGTKKWQDEAQMKAFKKIMEEHRGRGFGEVTHTKLYESHPTPDGYYTVLPISEDKQKLRDSYINQDLDFKQALEDDYAQRGNQPPGSNNIL